MEPLKLGIRTQPPALTLVYNSSSSRKKRYRVMPIRFLNKFGSVENVLKEMKDRHKEYLEKVCHFFRYKIYFSVIKQLGTIKNSHFSK